MLNWSPFFQFCAFISLCLARRYAEELWTLDGDNRVLETATYRNKLYNEFDGQSAILNIGTDKIRNLAEGSLIEFHLLSGIEASCVLRKGISGQPDSKYAESFSCNPTTLSELHLIRNNFENTLTGTYFAEEGKNYYLELAFHESSESYIFYNSADLLKHPNPPEHHHIFDVVPEIEEAIANAENQGQRDLQEISPTDIIRYRLAILTSREFSDIHDSNEGLEENQRARVSSFIQNAVSRVNGIFVRQLAIHFQLAENFEAGICLSSDSRPACATVDNTNGDRESTGTILEELGVPATSYDLAHKVFSSLFPARTQLNVACSDANKHLGASPSFAISIDVSTFVVLFFAHELAHQLGSGHTFRDCRNNNDSNLFEAEAVEPGSGTSLMSFAGTCGGETNLKNNREAYLHSTSIEGIREKVERRFLGTLNCGERLPVTQTLSTLKVPLQCSVPIDTPFVLLGASNLASGSGEFYAWDRVDTGSEDYTVEAPGRFRAYEPILNRADRFFPNLNYLNFVQDRDFEILPTIERTMTFRFSARTNFRLNDQLTSFSTSLGGTYIGEETEVEFVNRQSLQFNALPTEPISLNQGFRLSWNSGNLGQLSSDGRGQIFFAENTMSEVTDFSDFDYKTEVDDLNWIFLKEVQISAGSSCISIQDSDVDLDRLDTFVGNIMIKVNVNNNGAASVRNTAGCFVFDILTDLTFTEDSSTGFQLCNAGTRGQLPTLIELVEVVGAEPPSNDETSAGGSGAGAAVAIIITLIALTAIVGVVVYRRRKETSIPMIVDDEAPAATPHRLGLSGHYSLRKSKKRRLGSLSLIGQTPENKDKPSLVASAKSVLSGFGNKMRTNKPVNQTNESGAPRAISKELSKRLVRDPFPGFQSPMSAGSPKQTSHKVSRELSRTLTKDPFPDEEFKAIPKQESFSQKSKRNISAGLSTLNRKRREKTKQIASMVKTISKKSTAQIPENGEVIASDGPKITFTEQRVGNTQPSSTNTPFGNAFNPGSNFALPPAKTPTLNRTKPRPPNTPFGTSNAQKPTAPWLRDRPFNSSENGNGFRNFEASRRKPVPPKSPFKPSFGGNNTNMKGSKFGASPFAVAKSTPRPPKTPFVKQTTKSNTNENTELPSGVSALRKMFESQNNANES